MITTSTWQIITPSATFADTWTCPISTGMSRFCLAASISQAKLWVVGLSFASLPWLSVRFFVIVAVLVVLVVWRWHDPRRRLWPVLLMTALSSALYLWVNQILLASQPPAVAVNQFASTS